MASRKVPVVSDSDKKILVCGETAGRTLDSMTIEAVACAERAAEMTGASVTLALPCADVHEFDIMSGGGINVIALTNPLLKLYSAAGYIAAMERAVRETSPELVLIPGTSRGNDFAPALAVRLGAVFVPGVASLKEDGGSLVFTRSCWHGKAEMELKQAPGLTVATIQPGSFAGPAHRRVRAMVHEIKIDLAIGDTVPEGEIRAVGEADSGLRNAEVIVSAGRGIGRVENLALLEETASLFARSAVGASRPVCDYGWLPYGRQIGQTGKQVSPKLYMACGISGSPQHIAGMKSSANIVAVNIDPEAPIFRYAHAGVVADLTEFLRAFIDLVREKKKTGR